jgi:hypothetical protein
MSGVVGEKAPVDDLTVHRVVGEIITSYGDTLFTMPRDQELVYATPGFVMAQPMPFGRRAYVGVVRDGTVWSYWTGMDRVWRRDVTGKPMYEVRVPFAVKRRVAERDLERAISVIEGRDGERAGRMLRLSLEQAEEEDRAPESWPIATNVRIDGEDRLWISLLSEDDLIEAGTTSGYKYGTRDGQSQRVVIVEERGRGVRSGWLPVRGWIGGVNTDRIYVVAENHLGLQSVEAFRYRMSD